MKTWRQIRTEEERQARAERNSRGDRIDSCILPVLAGLPVLGLIGMASPLCALLGLTAGVVAIACYILIE